MQTWWRMKLEYTTQTNHGKPRLEKSCLIHVYNRVCSFFFSDLRMFHGQCTHDSVWPLCHWSVGFASVLGERGLGKQHAVWRASVSRCRRPVVRCLLVAGWWCAEMAPHLSQDPRNQQVTVSNPRVFWYERGDMWLYDVICVESYWEALLVGPRIVAYTCLYLGCQHMLGSNIPHSQ